MTIEELFIRDVKSWEQILMHRGFVFTFSLVVLVFINNLLITDLLLLLFINN